MYLLFSALLAYLIGSICVSIPISKRFYGGDIRTRGSGNAGATNMARVYGMGAGLITLLLDALKTVIAMLLGTRLAGESGAAIAGAGCIVGHCFPLYFSLRGGKGVSVGAMLGLMTGLAELGCIMAVFFAVAVSTRKVSLGSVCAAAALPCSAALLGVRGAMLYMCIFAAVLVIFMHRGNLARVLAGTEADFSPKKKER